MNLVCGVDLIEIERVEQAVNRFGDRFLYRIFTLGELEDVGLAFPSLAARFAAKESVAKALGTGIGDVGWLDIEVLRNPARQPFLILHGVAAQLSQELGIKNWSLSLSHSQSHAIAFVIGHD